MDMNHINDNSKRNKNGNTFVKVLLIVLAVIMVILIGIAVVNKIYETYMQLIGWANEWEYSDEEADNKDNDNIENNVTEKGNDNVPGGLTFTTIRSKDAFAHVDSDLPDWVVGSETDPYEVNYPLYPYADIEYDNEREGYYITVHPYYAVDKKFEEEVYCITRVDNGTNEIMNWWNEVYYPLMTKSEVYLNLDRAKMAFKEGKYDKFGTANYGLEELVDENVYYNDRVQYMRFDCEITSINSEDNIMSIEFYDPKEAKYYQEVIETSLIEEYMWLFDLQAGDEISLFVVYSGTFVYRDDTTVYPLLIAVGGIPKDGELPTISDDLETETDESKSFEDTEYINIYGTYQRLTSDYTARAEVSLSTDTGETTLHLGVYYNDQDMSSELKGVLEHVEGNVYNFSQFRITFINGEMKVEKVLDGLDDYYGAFEGTYDMVSQVDWSQVG